MSQGTRELETQSDLGYGQLFSKLWQDRFLFVGVFSGVLAVAIPLVLIQKPVYQSNMQVLVESNYQAKELQGDAESEFADATVEIDYATHLKVLKSSEILKRAIKKLGLEDSEHTVPEIVQELRKSLTVYRLTDEESGSDSGIETNIIQTLYTGDDPEETKRVLDAIQEVYLDYNLEQQEKRLQDGLTFIKNQIPQARQDLIKAEEALTQLSKQHSLVSPETEAIALEEDIREIARQREALKAQVGQFSGNYQTLQQQLGLSPRDIRALSRLSQSRSYQDLQKRLQEIEIRLANESQKYTQESPLIQSLLDERDTQRDLLLKEAKGILGEVPDNLVPELESLQRQGQFVGSNNSNKITETQVNLAGIRERDLKLAETQLKLEQKLVNFPELIAEYRNLAQEAEVKRGAIQRLLKAKQELEIELNRGGFNWQVIEPPLLGEKIAPSIPKNMFLSLIFATFLGGLAVFFKSAVDERITNPLEIKRQTAIPILGTTPGLYLSPSERFFAQIPFISVLHTSNSMKEIIRWNPFREAIDLIYENVKLTCTSRPIKSLAVTSAISGEGKSTFVLGLALSVARHQQKVLVIDADLRSASLHLPFNLTNDHGLANFLAGERMSVAVERVSLLGETIDLITSGPRPADPVKLLSSAKLQSLIEQHQQNYDLILVDTPPVIGMADAITIATHCDSTVMMMRLDKVKTTQLLEATSLISKLNVLGIVANGSKEVTQEYNKQPQYSLPPQV
jgi:polysaccharide biosynthesis transport protein